MNNIDRSYKELLEQILHFGVKKADRTGTGTQSIFGWQIRHKMSEGFPLLTTKKMPFKTIVTELIWFLRGDTNIKFLLDNNCHIWDGDAYKNYCKNTATVTQEDEYWMCGEADRSFRQWTKEEFQDKIKTDERFATRWGNLGPIYGQQWRKWSAPSLYPTDVNKDGSKCGEYSDEYIDQLSILIDQIIKNPDSRRLMVTAWNPANVDQAILPPCHYGFQVYTKDLTAKERYRIWFDNNYETGFEYDDTKEVDYDNNYWTPTPKRSISLMWNQRSVDTPLGLPFNIASYGLLLILLGEIVGMVPDELIGNLGDTHIYLNQIDVVQEQLDRIPFDLPRLVISENLKLIIRKFNGQERINGVVDFGYYQKVDTVLSSIGIEDFIIQDYKSHKTIKIPLSN